MINKTNILERVYIAILLVIFGGIVLHAPISVALGTICPDYSLLIKSWKEILMLVTGVMALVLLYKKRQFVLLHDPLMMAIMAYAALHLGLLTFNYNNAMSSVAGLMIDLRYVLYFGLVYLALKLYPGYRRLFIKVGMIGALVVLVFALLQVFVLPNDILKYIGYNINTISPYLTVDQNNDFIRINSTLRGPNPLGAYAGIVLTLIVAVFVRRRVGKDKSRLVLMAILIAGGVVALWASYSRSALIAAMVAIALVLIIAGVSRLSSKKVLIAATVLVVLFGGLWLARGTSFVSNVLLHENPNGDNSINSNEGHVNSLADGLNQIITQPLGDGVGSTGSASLYGSKPLIIENQYLFTAHEVGWLGLIIFIYIFGLIMDRLWRLRQDWLALGIFASGVGLALIGLLLPVWADDVVAIIWWGLAAVALTTSRRQK